MDVHLKQLLGVRGKAQGAGGGHAAGSTWPGSTIALTLNPCNHHQTQLATRQIAESNSRHAPCSARVALTSKPRPAAPRP